VAPQRLQRKHNLSRLPPQHVFVAAEAIEGAVRQIRQAQEAVGYIFFESELSSFASDASVFRVATRCN
jgi:hypothetical protein